MKKVIVALAVFFLSAIYITYPLVFHMGTLATGTGDELLIAWTHNWVLHALLTNPFSLFEANLYFPYHNTLAYSDLYLTTSLLAAIPIAIIGQPIVANNFTIIFSLILLGFSTYLLSFYLTKNYFASLVAGVLVVFSPVVLDKTVHIQILAIEWVPLALLAFFHFLKSRKTRYLLLSLLFFLLQTYTSFLPGYFILFSYVIIFIYQMVNKNKKTLQLITKKNTFSIILAFLVILPIVIPYFQVAKEFSYARDIRDAVHFSLEPEDLLYPSIYTRMQDVLLTLPFNQVSQNNEFKPGFPGVVFGMLILVAFGYYIKHFKTNGKLLHPFITIALTGVTLSLGPVLHLGRQTVHVPFVIPLPYSLFYYLIPGFQGFRNSARWELLFILAMAIVIAIVLDKLLKKHSFHFKSIIYCILIIGCVWEFKGPMHFVSLPQKQNFPKEYQWLTTTPQDTAYIELPVYNWYMWPYTKHEIWREYYSTIHFRKAVNGYSGFSPPPWQKMIVNTLADFPSNQTIAELKKREVNYVLIHKDEYTVLHNAKFSVNNHILLSGKGIVLKIEKYPSLQFKQEIDGVRIYRIK